MSATPIAVPIGLWTNLSTSLGILTISGEPLLETFIQVAGQAARQLTTNFTGGLWRHSRSTTNLRCEHGPGGCWRTLNPASRQPVTMMNQTPLSISRANRQLLRSTD